jgi:peptidoglycan hydrolase-like protein with peptidoglycan-binding domain
MNKIIFPLKESMQGPAVVDLQDALRLCLDRGALLASNESSRRELLAALIPERNAQSYGPTTTRLVTVFQRERQLEGRGEVDERTANALNSLLTEWGVLDQPPEPAPRPSFVVKGQVRNPDGLPVSGTNVKAFDRNLRGETLLGETATVADGNYEIRYRAAQLVPPSKSAADLIVRAYGGDNNELAHSDFICHATAEATVNLVVGNASLRGPSEYDHLFKAIRPYLWETKLADLRREDVGFLSCSAQVDRVQVATLVIASRLSRDTGLPDWLFYALGRQGVLLQLSALLDHNVKSLRESIERAIKTNIVAPVANLAELDRWMGELESVLLKTAFEPAADPGRLSLGEAVEMALINHDVKETFVSRYLTRKGSPEEFWRDLEEDEFLDPKAREDIRFTLHLGMLTQYHAPLMQRLKGLRQHGELKSLRDLAQFDRNRWRQLLEAGATNGEIILPPDTPGQTPIERQNNYVTTLREPIERLFPSDSLRHVIVRTQNFSPEIRTFLSNNPDLDVYWGNVDQFVAEHADPAFAGIADDQRTAVVEEIKVLQRLLRVAPSADQVTVLRHAGFTSAYAIARTSRQHFRKRFAETAAELKDNLDDAYMVLSTTEDVPSGETPIMLLSGKTPETIGDIIFNQASGKAAASIEYLVNANMLLEPWPFAVGGSKEAQEQAKKDFFKKNPNLETLFGSLSYCECEHCRSVYSPAAYLVDLLHWLDNLEKLPNQSELKYKNAGQAMLPGGKAKAPINVLLSRRPDLQEIALTCENTNTPLPYVDLVNETLESFIFTHLKAIPNIDPNKPVVYEWSEAPVIGKTMEAKDTGKAKAAELRAVPQYIIPEVYEHLATKAVYPITLPFHRPLEVVRAYLGHLGTSWAEIMEVFRTGTPLPLSDEDISRERLGLSLAVADIITASGNAGTVGNMDVWRYYGFDAEMGFAERVAKVPEFLARTGLSMEELVALLKTRFINPHLYDKTTQPVIAIKVDLVDPCDVSKMSLENLTWTGNDVSDNYHWLKRIHCFLRLWHALDWSMPELDVALHAFGSTQNNNVLHEHPNALSRLEAVSWLHEELNVSVPALSAFWSALDTWGEDSTYAHLFLTQPLTPKNAGSDNSAVLELFKLNQTGTELAAADKNLTDHLAPVFATLQLTTADYDAIATQEFAGVSAAPKLNIKNLSLLYRYGTLARALNLRVKEIVSLIRLVPEDHYPFRAGDSLATRRFVRLARTVEETSFTVALLNYLFRHEEEPTRHPAPTRILIITTLKTIADGLAQIVQETQPTDDPSGELLREQLGRLQPLLTAPKPGEETQYIKPEEIQQTVDEVDWRRENFQPSLGKAFLQKLHDTLLKGLNSSFLGPSLDADKNALFGNLLPNETKDERFGKNIVYLRDKLLPWLRVRLQRSLISQTFASALGIDESVGKALLERVLQSTAAGTTQPALSDFLDLAALNDFLKLVQDQAGTQPFDVLNDKGPIVRTFLRLFKAAQLAKGFEMTEAELTYQSENSSEFENFTLNKLPLKMTQSETLPKELFVGWIALERFFDLRNSLPKSEKSLVDVLKDKSLPTLVEATGWDKQWLKSPPEGLGVALPNLTVVDLVKLRSAIALIKRTGAPTKTLLLWAAKEPDHEQAEEVIEAVKSRFDGDQWLEVARGLNDPLREKQRDALVGLLVARMTRPHPMLKTGSPLKDSVKELQGKLNFALSPFQVLLPGVLPLTVDGIFGLNTQTVVKTFQQVNKLTTDGFVGPTTWAALDRAVGDLFDKNSLLEHFLIDVEMSSCMLTSRIKQAISSVQMFVQRCLLNLESEVSPADIDADQWKWMKNYRVWEANRKVFLYVENWWEPELRDDKTPFFKELETELLQNELTDKTVETALGNYLYKLDEVARLDIRGFCKEEKEEDAKTKEIYHVFGRTWNPPYVYYYRKGIFPKNGPLAAEWTPWEKVELDIQGDHLIPIVVDARLHLYWLVFDRKTIPRSSANQPVASSDEDSTDSSAPEEEWQIRLCWSEYQSGKWSSKTVGKQSLRSHIRILPENLKNFEWRAEKERLAQELGTTDPEVENVPARYGARVSLEDKRVVIQLGEEKFAVTPFRPDDELNFDSVGSFILDPCRRQFTVRGDKDWTIYGLQESTINGVVIVSRHNTLCLPHVATGDVLTPNLSVFGNTQPLLFVLAPPDLKVPSNPWLMSWFPFFFRDDNTKLASSYFARPVLEVAAIPIDTATWKESSVTIDTTPTMGKSGGWKSMGDPVAKLAGIATSGILGGNG